MSRLTDMTKEFHLKYGLTINALPTLQVSDEEKNMRVSLIVEELEELCDALDADDIVEVADALADLLYVVSGAGHVFGIDLDAVLEEVQRSNLSKLGEDGKPIYREDGKVLKGPNFSEPDVNKVLVEQVLNHNPGAEILTPNANHPDHPSQSSADLDAEDAYRGNAGTDGIVIKPEGESNDRGQKLLDAVEALEQTIEDQHNHR